MEGDKVSITSTSIEMNGIPVHVAEISEKPQFMLAEEYTQEIIECAILAVQTAYRTIYPNNPTAQSRISDLIAKMAKERIEGEIVF